MRITCGTCLAVNRKKTIFSHSGELSSLPPLTDIVPILLEIVFQKIRYIPLNHGMAAIIKMDKLPEKKTNYRDYDEQWDDNHWDKL